VSSVTDMLAMVCRTFFCLSCGEEMRSSTAHGDSPVSLTHAADACFVQFAGFATAPTSFNQPLHKWDVGAVKDMRFMVRKKLTCGNGILTHIMHWFSFSVYSSKMQNLLTDVSAIGT
jgi:hypothetical protein